jgi:hypothetical protein
MPRKYTRKIRRRRVKRGGDIESGTVENVTPMSTVPPDPDRFKKYQDRMIRDISKPVSNEEAAAVFAGPNPDQKLKIEQNMMGNEDPWAGLSIFGNTGGRRSRKSRKNKRKVSRHRRR